MNMVNFLDGLDGLAAGVCGIAGGTFAVIALSLGKPNAAAFSAIVLGACLGFLRHNFFPARIFMGDSGAMLLGFSLAAVSVEGLLKTAATVALFFPLLVLAVPILDTGLRRRAEAQVPACRSPRPTRRTCTTASSTSASRSGGRSSTSTSGSRRWPPPRSARASSRSARTAAGTPWPTVGGDRARPARGRRVDLHGLPARDRQAREPAHPPPAPRGGEQSPPQRLIQGQRTNPL